MTVNNYSLRCLSFLLYDWPKRSRVALSTNHQSMKPYIYLFICGGVCERAVNSSNSGSGGRGFKQRTRKDDIELYSTSELSLRARDRGFPPVSMNIIPGYFHRKIEENRTKGNP